VRAKLATVSLFIASLLAAMELGGSLYEALVVYPAWSASPPATLALLQGPNSVNSTPFWIPIHVSLEIMLAVALALNWRARARRNLVLLGIGIHMLVRVWTFMYFIPEILAFTSIAPNGPYSGELVACTELWGQLGWIRRALIGLDSVLLLLALMRPGPLSSANALAEPRERHPEHALAGNG
jgi:hypothetical protein